MRRLLFLVLLVGCGDSGGGGTPDAAPGSDGPAATCDVLRTDACASNLSQPKCSVVVAEGTLTTRCTAQNGTLAPGATCTRGAQTGIDDCDKGVWCSGLGIAANMAGDPVMSVCRAFCSDDSRCGTGERCLTFLSMPKVGYCLPTGCAVFGSDCPQNTACLAFRRYDETQFSGVCSPPGPVQPGGDCSRLDCVANVRCVAETTTRLICHPYCDATHACEGATTCTALPGMPNSAGYCR